MGLVALRRSARAAHIQRREGARSCSHPESSNHSSGTTSGGECSSAFASGSTFGDEEAARGFNDTSQSRNNEGDKEDDDDDDENEEGRRGGTAPGEAWQRAAAEAGARNGAASTVLAMAWQILVVAKLVAGK